MNFFSESEMAVVSKELGTVMVNNLLLNARMEALTAAVSERDATIEGLKARIVAHEIDIDALRAQVGAQPVPRRGRKA